ncbi:hypothetical protein GQ53DRAFT_37354 [Thozetella sp. PMI_491]|nr:hypothetical protein GQ53DRAFT_37354 [Thozetella sp. PMI_491]
MGHPPFLYLARAREIVQFHCVKFLASLVLFKEINGTKVVRLLMDASQWPRLRNELRTYVLEAFRAQMASDLHNKSKEASSTWSTAELDRLGTMFTSVTKRTANYVLVDGKGVSPNQSCAALEKLAETCHLKSPASYHHPANWWHEVLRKGLQPYPYDTPSSSVVAALRCEPGGSTTCLNAVPFDEPRVTEDSEAELLISPEGLRSLKKYRPHITETAERIDSQTHTPANEKGGVYILVSEEASQLGQTQPRRSNHKRASRSRSKVTSKSRINQTNRTRSSTKKGMLQTVVQFIRGLVALRKSWVVKTPHHHRGIDYVKMEDSCCAFQTNLEWVHFLLTITATTTT